MCVIFESKKLSCIILQAVTQYLSVAVMGVVPLRSDYEAEYCSREGSTSASCSKVPGSDVSVETCCSE
jgi:hypothetical protein